ncbi:response regulator [Nonomuraea typhae]|uniref:response regulator n=1 Tax=Nonomuraea typhae TaxID=2603600 RepID=UPI0012F76756
MIRVLIVDDHELIRQGLRKFLDVEEDIEVVGEAADGVQALAALAAPPYPHPDIVLVDARMPGMDGVQLITRLAGEHPKVAALVLSTFEEDDYIVGALRAGARGYLLKDCSPDDLVNAIRRTYRTR